MPKRQSELLNTSVVVYGADREFAAEACIHLASVGARLFLTGTSEERLLEVDAQLSQSEIHRVLAERDPWAIAPWLFEHASPIGGVVAFFDVAPDEEACRELFTPLLQRLDAKHPTVPTLVVYATRPGVAHGTISVLPDMTIAALRVSSLSARNVTSLALLSELTQTAASSGRTRDEHLAELYGGILPNPLLTARELGGLVETLLGSFSRFSRGRHYEFDGGPTWLPVPPLP